MQLLVFWANKRKNARCQGWDLQVIIGLIGTIIGIAMLIWGANLLVDGAAGLAKKCEIQIAYAIGVAQPVSVMIDLMGTGIVPKYRVQEIVNEVFDLRPASIIEYLDLLRPVFEKTAAYGHFGRDEPEFTWEKTNMVDILREKAGLS